MMCGGYLIVMLFDWIVFLVLWGGEVDEFDLLNLMCLFWIERDVFFDLCIDFKIDDFFLWLFQFCGCFLFVSKYGLYDFGIVVVVSFIWDNLYCYVLIVELVCVVVMLELFVNCQFKKYFGMMFVCFVNKVCIVEVKCQLCIFVMLIEIFVFEFGFFDVSYFG